MNVYEAGGREATFTRLVERFYEGVATIRSCGRCTRPISKRPNTTWHSS
jgi:hypothetical protein